MSLDIAKLMAGPPRSTYFRIIDNHSIMARFNDEKSWVEYALTRALPSATQLQSTQIIAIISSLRGAWVYKNLEAAVDGVVDFKLEEEGEETRNLIRIRSMHNVDFDSKWHPLKVVEGLQITLDK